MGSRLRLLSLSGQVRKAVAQLLWGKWGVWEFTLEGVIQTEYQRRMKVSRGGLKLYCLMRDENSQGGSRLACVVLNWK